MTKAIYRITREVGVVTGIFLSVYVVMQGYFIRSIMNIILMLLFITFSISYEKKYNAITTGYIFVFFILLVTNSLFSCYFTEQTIANYNILGDYGAWTKDFYNIYFWGLVPTYIILILYVKSIKTRKVDEECNFKITNQDNNSMEVGCIVLFIIFLVTNKNYMILIPLLTCLIGKCIWAGEKLRSIIEMVIVVLLSTDALTSRYKFIQITFPIILMFLMVNKWRHSKISMFKVHLLIGVFLVLVVVYGVVSEIYKLNTSWGQNISLIDIMNNKDKLEYFIMHQLYRVSFIWIKLGAYIIEHVQNNGYFYGLTYIKSLAPIFGFDYISLPKIVAVYDKAKYAQPGLFAEGYANFGVIGIVINLMAVFLLMEHFTKHFYKKPSFYRLLLATVPFAKIILDGGTFNSALSLLIICLGVNLVQILKTRKIYRFS